jgi:hypothetical protein
LELHVDRSPAQQFFGSHRTCLASRLAKGFALEIESLLGDEQSQAHGAK